MEKQKISFDRTIRLCAALLAGGIVLFLVGLAVRVFAPSSTLNPKWIESFGIFFAGWGIISLSRYVLAARDPLALKRLKNEEQDERVLAIRQRAGNTTFLFMYLLSCLALVTYSVATAGQNDMDPLSLYLGFLVIGPGLVYVICLWKYSREQ